jgi:predicted transcriptional regulator
MAYENDSDVKTVNMTDETPIVMGSKEYEMIELFRRINISRPIALTLACLAKKREISSQTIEILSGLRQPEVSIAMRYLRENNWVEVREEKKTKGKGRPIKLYILTIPMDQIISSIEEEVMAESRVVLRNIELLKKMPGAPDTE